MSGTSKVHPDQNIILGIQSQDRLTLNRLYTEFYPGISAFIQRNNGSETEARDIFQEAVIVIYRKAIAGTLTLTSPFSSYLITVCRNMWFNVLKKKSFTTEVTNETLSLSIDDSDIERTLHQREKDRLYREKYRLLAEDCRKVLQLFFDGTKMEKIKEIMGYKSISYAKKRKFKCKEKLVSLIESDARYRELI